MEYLKYCYKAGIAKQKNPSLNVKDWTNTNDIKAFLQPLKQDGETWPKSNRPGYGRQRIKLVVEKCVMSKWETWIKKEQLKGEIK